MRDWLSMMRSQNAVAIVLLLHTIGAAAQSAATLVLFRALYLLRRNGETPRGFVSIAAFMLFASVTRMSRLLLTWFGLQPPDWLDLATGTLLFICILIIPIILSARYFPLKGRHSAKQRWDEWLQWTIVMVAIVVDLYFMIAPGEHAQVIASVIATATCIVSAVMLCLRAQFFGNLQLRQRGLLLFTGLTSLGLLGISVLLLYRFWLDFAIFNLVITTASLEFFNMLIILGMMFAFASLPLADVIAKQVVGIYIWSAVSLLLWAGVRYLGAASSVGSVHEAERALGSVASIVLALVLTPMTVQRVNRWVDEWVFQVQNFDVAIQRLWDELVELDTAARVYRAGEEAIRNTLSLAAARIIRLSDLRLADTGLPPIGPNPTFLSANSSLRSIVTPPADVLVPLNQEDAPEHWIVLTNGALRPPLTAVELGFVARIAVAIQVRIGSLLGEQRRLERAQRDSAFREEIADAELRALRAQINPHFLFNSLNTIADLAVVAPDKAEEMTLRLAAVFRYVLANTERQFTSVKEEIQFATSYLGIEEARFGDRLIVRFDVDQSVLQERVPTLLLQPLIENALKHGLSPKREGGTLNIEAKRTTTGFTLTVTDDGVGLETARENSPDNSSHVGILNVRNRLRTAYGSCAQFTLSPRDGGGTKASLVFTTGEEESA
jgi:anti-sigma regulatory factor (Ser/Thr protein kinase)